MCVCAEARESAHWWCVQHKSDEVRGADGVGESKAEVSFKEDVNAMCTVLSCKKLFHTSWSFTNNDSAPPCVRKHCFASHTLALYVAQ